MTPVNSRAIGPWGPRSGPRVAGSSLVDERSLLDDPITVHKGRATRFAPTLCGPGKGVRRVGTPTGLDFTVLEARSC